MATYNTGNKIYNNLQQVYVDTGLPTSEDPKPNDPDDPDYIPPTVDDTTCPPPTPPEQQINKLSIKFTNNTSQTVAFNGLILRAESISDLSQAYYQSANFSLYKNTTFTAPIKNQLDDITRLIATVQGLSLNIRTKVTIGYQQIGDSSPTQLTSFDIATGDNISIPLSTLRTANNNGTNQLFITFADDPIVPPDNNPPNVSIVEGTALSIILPVSSITITGSATDPDVGGLVVSTLWTQVSGPSTATIESPNSLQSKFSSLIQGTYVFKFAATDNYGAGASVTCTVLVKPAVANPNGLVNIYVDSLMPDTTIKITQVSLRDSSTGAITDLLTTPVDKTSGNVLVTPLKGTYTFLITVAGSVSTRSLKIQWGSGSVIINTPTAGIYGFDGVVVDEGVNGVIINLKATQTGDPSFPILFARQSLGSTTTSTENTLPNGKTETVTGDVIESFYSDAGTTPANFTGTVAVSTAITDNIHSSTINSFSTASVTDSPTTVVASLRSYKEWDWTLNDPNVQEDPADKTVDASYVYTLLPGQGYLLF